MQLVIDTRNYSEEQIIRKESMINDLNERYVYLEHVTFVIYLFPQKNNILIIFQSSDVKVHRKFNMSNEVFQSSFSASDSHSSCFKFSPFRVVTGTFPMIAMSIHISCQMNRVATFVPPST